MFEDASGLDKVLLILAVLLFSNCFGNNLKFFVDSSSLTRDPVTCKGLLRLKNQINPFA